MFCRLFENLSDGRQVFAKSVVYFAEVWPRVFHALKKTCMINYVHEHTKIGMGLPEVVEVVEQQ